MKYQMDNSGSNEHRTSELIFCQPDFDKNRRQQDIFLPFRRLFVFLRGGVPA